MTRRPFPLPELASPSPEVWSIRPYTRLACGPALAKAVAAGVSNTPRNDQSGREVPEQLR
jgi:hypothetical protein